MLLIIHHLLPTWAVLGDYLFSNTHCEVQEMLPVPYTSICLLGTEQHKGIQQHSEHEMKA